MNNPTDEQLDIIAEAESTSNNIMINALAGTGKTTTLEMVEAVVKQRPILYLCFNKKNAEEASSRMRSTTKCKTLNSAGYGAWSKAIVDPIKMDFHKTKNIFKSLVDKSPKNVRNEMWDAYFEVSSGVNLAKALGYIPEAVSRGKRLIAQPRFHSMLEERPDDFVSDLIDACLSRSIELSFDGVLDFNDQVYMPALFGGDFPRFPLVMVDEHQDLSPVNLALLDRLITGRYFGVGDRWQNIYGFRGASALGMETNAEKYKMTKLDLSISFRCPQAIVEAVHWRVPHFKWLKDGGSVSAPNHLDAVSISHTATIICRNNAPLFACAFKLLGAGYSVNVSGSDIGPKLVTIMRKLGPDDMTQSQTLTAIEFWLAEKLAKENKHAIDMAECMTIFAKQTPSLSSAINYAEHLFKQDGSVKLMTGHKSKGQEFDDVIHLDPHLCGHSEQDKNLAYVISTRSKDRLTEIASSAIRWP